MHRFEPTLRVLLIIAWSIAVASNVVAQVLFAHGSDPVLVSALLVVLNLPPGVAIVAVRYPSSMPMLRDRNSSRPDTSHRTLVGLWTTAIVTVASGLVIGGAFSLIGWTPDGLVGAGLVALVVVCTHLVGFCLYLFVGEFLVAVFLVSTARLRGVRAPLDRLATGTLLILVATLCLAAFASLPAGASAEGGTPRGRGVALILFAIIRFDGTPLEQTLCWIARLALIGVVASYLWLRELRARGHNR